MIIALILSIFLNFPLPILMENDKCTHRRQFGNEFNCGRYGKIQQTYWRYQNRIIAKKFNKFGNIFT